MNVDRDFTKDIKGKKLMKKKVEKEIGRDVAFNVLRAVMPAEKARDLAGYSDGTKIERISSHDSTVSAIRERLQQAAGVTLEDQVKWYAGIRDRADNISDQLSAAKQIDTVLGYNAPQKVEMTERRELLAAIQVVSNIGVNPMELKNMIRRRKEVEISRQ